MKTLYLLRHAESAKEQNFNDIERSITNDGIREVTELAKKIADKEIHFDLVMCSPAKRTLQTCELLLKSINNNSEIKNTESLYEPTIDEFLKTISKIDENINSVLIVSHNPTISEVTNFLCNSSYHFISFSPANLAKIDLNLESWNNVQENCGSISWFL